MSWSQYPSSVITLPRYLNCVFLVQLPVHQYIYLNFSSPLRDMHITLFFLHVFSFFCDPIYVGHLFLLPLFTTCYYFFIFCKSHWFDHILQLLLHVRCCFSCHGFIIEVKERWRECTSLWECTSLSYISSNHTRLCLAISFCTLTKAYCHVYKLFISLLSFQIHYRLLLWSLHCILTHYFFRVTMPIKIDR